MGGNLPTANHQAEERDAAVSLVAVSELHTQEALPPLLLERCLLCPDDLCIVMQNSYSPQSLRFQNDSFIPYKLSLPLYWDKVQPLTQSTWGRE